MLIAIFVEAITTYVRVRVFLKMDAFLLATHRIQTVVLWLENISKLIVFPKILMHCSKTAVHTAKVIRTKKVEGNKIIPVGITTW